MGAIAFVLKGYPRLSETFIAQEILGLERRGLNLRLYAMRQPTDPAVHPVHREIAAAVTYLPEYLHEAPLRVLRAWRTVRKFTGYAATKRAFWQDFRRDRSRNRLRRFGQALVLAFELPDDVTALHAHFLHTPSSVTRYASLLRGLPWSASAHAKDVWTTPQWELRDKIAHCCWLVTCTAANQRYLSSLAPAGRVKLLYHGLDVSRFPTPVRAPSQSDGHGAPVVILCVSRAVPKKGLGVLLDALAKLPKDIAWQLEHVGAGPLLSRLDAQARQLRIAERITWFGARPQNFVLERCRAADLFVLPCRIAEDGDRDGLPNVLMEAQSQGLACLSTRVSAVPELIIDGETGLLVSPDDPASLADALLRLISDPPLRHRLGQAGQHRVRSHFSHDEGLDRLATLFGHRPASPKTHSAKQVAPVD